jgi:hypothetical protein
VILRHAGSVVLGAAVAVASVAVYRSTALGVPFGLLLAVAASLGTAARLRWSRRPRLAASYAAGFLVVFGLVIAGRPEGDYAVASDVRGYTLMAASLAVLVLGVTALGAPRPGGSPGRGDGGT